MAHGLHPGKPKWSRYEERSGDHFFVEALPVIEVVEIDGIEDFSFVRNARGCKDGGADLVGMIITGDGGIQFRDSGGVERSTGLCEHPGFELRIGRLGGDEALKRRFVEAETVEDHLVVALTTGWIIGVKLADGTERGFLPKARQVEDAEGACGAGAD